MCEKQLQQLPKGKLLVTEKRGRPYYSLFLDRHSYYLRTEDARIQLLQDRHLVEETLQGVTRQLTLLEDTGSLTRLGASLRPIPPTPEILTLVHLCAWTPRFALHIA